MDLLLLKIVFLAAILGIAILGGLIPLISARFKNSERFFSLGNAFAGGLFLGVGFIHLLPEGMEILSQYSDFPWGVIYATIGFTVLLLLDRILFPVDVFGTTNAKSVSEVVYPYVLLAMLSIHSIVAGIALGLEPHVAGLVAVFIGILFHKGPAAFALIVSTHASGLNISIQKKILIAFSIMTPIGIIIGISSGFLLEADYETYSLIQGTFNSLAAGTFIYIAVIDIIDKELTSHHIGMTKYIVSAVRGDEDVPMPILIDDRYWKFLLIILGIVFVALMMAWTHSGDKHSDHMRHDEEHGAQTEEPTLYSNNSRLILTAKSQQPPV